MTIEKSIGWTDMTLNPIKGKCKGGCWYCWTKPLYKRKFLTLDIRLRLDVLEGLPKKPKKIFLCSTHDLFGDWIPTTWRDLIFAKLSYYPQHTFQILTKFPQNIDRPMPDNVWLGVSVTESEDMLRHWRLRDIKAIKFISMEPLLEDIISIPHIRSCDWIIIGRLTGHGKKYDPKKEWIVKWVRWARGHDIPIFLKNNLKEIWREPLIQEFPK